MSIDLDQKIGIALATTDPEEVTTEGLIGQIMAIEYEADELTSKAKDLNDKARYMRTLVIDKLKASGLTSATHESGCRATIRVTPVIQISDPEIALKSLKDNNLNIFLTPVAKQIIPAHEEINMDQFKTWLKSGTESQRKLIEGVEVIEKEALVIVKR